MRVRCWVIGTGKWPAAARNSGRAESRMKEEAYLDLIPVDCNPTARQPEPSISGELLADAAVRVPPRAAAAGVWV